MEARAQECAAAVALLYRPRRVVEVPERPCAAGPGRVEQHRGHRGLVLGVARNAARERGRHHLADVVDFGHLVGRGVVDEARACRRVEREPTGLVLEVLKGAGKRRDEREILVVDHDPVLGVRDPEPFARVFGDVDGPVAVEGHFVDHLSRAGDDLAPCTGLAGAARAGDLVLDDAVGRRGILERLRVEDSELLVRIEKTFGIKLAFRADPNYHVENFKIINANTNEEYR